MLANAMDVAVVLAASFPSGCLALNGSEIITGEPDLFPSDARVRTATLVLGATNDAVVVRTTADGTVVV